MPQPSTEEQLHAVSNQLVGELIQLTPPSMSEVEFEIVSADDGGADFGLVENHPDARRVALSEVIHDCCARYLPLVKAYLPAWRRSLIVLKEEGGEWKVSVKFEREEDQLRFEQEEAEGAEVGK